MISLTWIGYRYTKLSATRPSVRMCPGLALPSALRIQKNSIAHSLLYLLVHFLMTFLGSCESFFCRVSRNDTHIMLLFSTVPVQWHVCLVCG